MKWICLALLATAVLAADFNSKGEGEKAAAAPAPAPEKGVSGVEVSCSAFGALKIRVTRGRCKGVAAANCTAIASSQNSIREAYGVWWSEGGECEKVKLEESARAVANATAAAYSATIAQVSCEGKGFACGWSISQGSAFAVTFAKAIAQAAVDTGGPTASAFCVADVEAVSSAIATAAASAQSKACVKDVGSETDFQAAMIEQLSQAISEAFVSAMATTCSDKEGFAGAATICAGEAGSTSTEEQKKEATEKAEATGSSTQIDACVNAGRCCDPSYKRPMCRCPDCGQRVWFRKSEAEGSRMRSWRTLDGSTCFCYPEKPHFAIV